MRYTVLLEQEADGGYVVVLRRSRGASAKEIPAPKPWPISARRLNSTSRIAAMLATRFRLREKEFAGHRGGVGVQPPNDRVRSPTGRVRPAAPEGLWNARGFAYRRQTGSHMVLRRDEPMPASWCSTTKRSAPAAPHHAPMLV